MMNKEQFESYVNNVVETLRTISLDNPSYITSCKSGDDFELRVVDAANRTLEAMSLTATVMHTPGSHAFPDIVIEFDDGNKYGIEVKSSSAAKSKGWKINGNSVMGSTRDESVIETYIIFGKTAASALDFKARKYEDCIANVVVTHSPRYLIDLDLPENETFFDISGISYKDITTSDNPIGLITRYFQSQGQKAWWLSESSPAAVRLFSDLNEHEQMQCFGYGLAHFPELFERNKNKYKRFATWLATEKSIVSPSLRDDFSAGGQVNLVLAGHAYPKLPQIFQRLIDYKEYFINALNAAEADVLCADWNIPPIAMCDEKSKVNTWISVAATHVATSQLNDAVVPLQLLKDLFAEYQ